MNTFIRQQGRKTYTHPAYLKIIEDEPVEILPRRLMKKLEW